MRIGIAEEALRYEHVEKADVKLDDEAMVEKVCDIITQSPDEFIVLKKKDGGFMAVPGRAIKFVETEGARK